MMVTEAFEFHAAQAPPNPLLQSPQEPPVSGPARGEVVACASNDSVEFLDELRVQIARTDSQCPHPVSKLLLRLVFPYFEVNHPRWFACARPSTRALCVGW